MATQDIETEVTITDEIAKDLGYPSAELFELDVELAELAGRYNATRDPEILKQHKALYDKMLDMGMTQLMFGADTEILRK